MKKRNNNFFHGTLCMYQAAELVLGFCCVALLYAIALGSTYFTLFFNEQFKWSYLVIFAALIAHNCSERTSEVSDTTGDE